jgi:hypothetical protein
MDRVLDLAVDRGPRCRESRGTVMSANDKKKREQAAEASAIVPFA